MVLFKNIGQLVTVGGKTPKRGPKMDELNTINAAYLIEEKGKIVDYGRKDKKIDERDFEKIVDVEGKVMMPGFVDPHTHFVFAGDRSQEFKMRLKGIPYIDILKKGGGILSTVKSTRRASKNELYNLSKKRVDKFLSFGVTTVEGKSGYGLDKKTELKQLEVMRELDNEKEIDIVSTFLGAHAVPKRYKNNSSEYIDYIIEEVMPGVAEKKLAEFCDVFCDDGAFSYQESEKLLKAAVQLGFKLKIHADEIVNTEASQLAGRLNVVSAEHLLKASEEGLNSLRENEVIAVLLPLTAFSLQEKYADARKMIEMGIPVALATDLNPGSSYSQSIPLLLSLAVMYMDMTPKETITALTINAACALNKGDVIGSIEKGKRADLLVIDAPDYNHLFYNFGVNLVEKVFKNGNLVLDNNLSKRRI
ncbi:MAG: imidazolonepropionase [Halanaerobiales bacterium]